MVQLMKAIAFMLAVVHRQGPKTSEPPHLGPEQEGGAPWGAQTFEATRGFCRHPTVASCNYMLPKRHQVILETAGGLERTALYTK